MQANLPLFMQGGIFIALLLAVSVIDIKKRIIPDTICLAIALTGFICFTPVKLLGVLAALPLLLAALVWGGLGGGDIIANDILSAVALMEADSVLRLVNCDLKSISYLSSQLPLLKDNKWDADKQYKVASNVKTNQASEHIEQVLGNVAFKIPHSDELENQFLAGDLFRDLALKDSRGFRKEIEKISKEVFGI